MECCVCYNLTNGMNLCHIICENCFLKILKICYCESKFGNILYLCPICRAKKNIKNKEMYSLINDSKIILYSHSECQQFEYVECKFKNCGCREQNIKHFQLLNE